MRLGLNLGYWGGTNDRDNLALAQEADRLGYAVCWVAEAYGSDAPTVLSWVAAQTRRIDVGAAVMQIPARTPAMTAMTAATLDALSGGRFRLGLGVSGPQVSEGWHGVRFAKPLGRTREYVEIVRTALNRRPLSHSGEHYTLPLPDGPGKALRLTVHPVRERIPIYLAAIGPKNLALAGEIADGWLGIFFSPEHAALALDPIRDARARLATTAGERDTPHAADTPDTGNTPDGFDVAVTVGVSLGQDVSAAADALRGYTALYVGGMGSREQNFYNALVRRMGYEEAAQIVQDLYLDRRPREAAAAVPVELIDETSLLGDRARIADRLQAFAGAGVTTLSIAPAAIDLPARLETLRTVAEAAELAGVIT